MNAKPASALKTQNAARERRAIVVVAAFGLVVLIPIIIWGIPVGNDLGNHYRFAIAFHDSMLSGKLYPGWLAPSNFGYAMLEFRFIHWSVFLLVF